MESKIAEARQLFETKAQSLGVALNNAGPGQPLRMSLNAQWPGEHVFELCDDPLRLLSSGMFNLYAMAAVSAAQRRTIEDERKSKVIKHRGQNKKRRAKGSRQKARRFANSKKAFANKQQLAKDIEHAKLLLERKEDLLAWFLPGVQGHKSVRETILYYCDIVTEFGGMGDLLFPKPAVDTWFEKYTKKETTKISDDNVEIHYNRHRFVLHSVADQPVKIRGKAGSEQYKAWYRYDVPQRADPTKPLEIRYYGHMLQWECTPWAVDRSLMGKPEDWSCEFNVGERLVRWYFWRRGLPGPHSPFDITQDVKTGEIRGEFAYRPISQESAQAVMGGMTMKDAIDKYVLPALHRDGFAVPAALVTFLRNADKNFVLE